MMKDTNCDGMLEIVSHKLLCLMTVNHIEVEVSPSGSTYESIIQGALLTSVPMLSTMGGLRGSMPLYWRGILTGERNLRR